jgi:hypothetical protein
MIKLKSLLLEEPQTAPTPTKPVTKPDTDTPAKPTPRRRSTPSPSTSPTPAPKAKTLMGEESEVMKQIVDRYMSAFNKLSEADYDNIFDPETLGKLKGSVTQRIQGKNPMQIMGNLMQLAQQVMQLEKGNEDLLEQLAYDVVYEAYPYLKSNQDVIEIDAKIVPQPQVKEALQPNSPNEEVDIEELSDTEEEQMMMDIADDLKKRRLINAVTQGGSTFSKSAHYVQQEYIDIIGGEGTSDKYRDLMQAALDMIDFVIGQGQGGRMSGEGLEDNATGAESVYYDFEKEKWVIKARAIVFPVLILEIIKGMYEIIGLFGFSDLERGEKVVKYTDKIENEPEDIAYGQMITKNLFDTINKLETNVTPEERDDFLQDIYKLENKEFIQLMTNVINNNVNSQQMNQLKGMFKQMRQDKTADDADNALFERLQRLAGL